MERNALATPAQRENMCGRSCGRITFHVRSHGDVLWSVCESSTFVLWWISQFHVSRVRMVCCGRVAIVSQINKRFRLFPRICVGVSEGDPDQDLNGKRWTASRPDVPDPAVRPQHWRWAFVRRVAVYFGSMLHHVTRSHRILCKSILFINLF